jgi:hypothetical protein
MGAPTAEALTPLRWLFVNRTTGAITVAQWPNAALWTFIVGSVVHRFGFRHGWTGGAVRVVTVVALCVWAVDEMARGVNPFRRLLGAVVLGLTVASLAAG